MRILLQGRTARSIASNRGGDDVMLRKTADGLRERGVEADVAGELTPPLERYDGVHLFNVVRPQEAWTQMRSARAQGKCVFVSPLYCTTWEYDTTARRGVLGALARHAGIDVVEAVKALGRAAVLGEVHRGLVPMYTKGYSALQRDILRSADMLMPNSRSEAERLRRDTGVEISGDRVAVVPIGIDPAFYDPARIDMADCPDELRRFEGCVLSVARIGGPKNQLTLVRAARELPMQVLIVGRAGPTQRLYWRQLQKESSPNVHLIGPVSEDAKWWLYRLARVHVLPSWIETTGLSSLEAAAMGCSLVITDKGDTREYFGSCAEYSDPASASSVRDAIVRAYTSPVSEQLQRKIADELNWGRSAEATVLAYEQGLERHFARGPLAGRGS